jgi:hypothetical protein
MRAAILLALPVAACSSVGLPEIPFLSGNSVDCPPLIILQDARQVIGAPAAGGQPSQGAYNHIGIVRGATATCADDSGRLSAIVTINYAVDGGPGTSGAARIELFAASTIKDVRVIDKLIATRSVRVAQGSPQLLSDTIGPITLPAAGEGPVEIAAGFQLTPAEVDFNRANPGF